MFIIFFTLCLFLTVITATITDIHVQTVTTGSNVMIKCGQNVDRKYYFGWYKMNFGQMLQNLVRTVKDSTKHRFSKEFDNDHFSIAGEEEKFDLKITKVSGDDLGTYFCVRVKESAIEFVSGTLLVFQAEKIKWHLQTEMVLKSGENSTLQCSLGAVKESCAGEHSVYWFRQDSNESAPGIIHTHINGSNQCTTGSDGGSPTHTCVYNLPFSYDRHSDGGTYYCAVAACGQILFGNGTKVHFEENYRGIVIALTISNVISVIIIMVLGGLLYKNQKEGSQNGHSRNTNKSEDTDDLNYAALKFAHKHSTSKISRVKENSDVYAQVKIK